MLWAVLRVASMFRQSRTQAFFRLRISRAEIVTEVWKRTLLLVCETGYLRFRIWRFWTKMHQEYFSILSAKVPSGSLPQSIPNGFWARVHSGSVFSCPAWVCRVRRNLYKRFSFKRSFLSAVSECKYLPPWAFVLISVDSSSTRPLHTETITCSSERALGLFPLRCPSCIQIVYN